MATELSPSARKVQDALERFELKCEVIELPASARTAKEAAAAVGCQVEQIVKSLVFRGAQTKRPVMVVASGPNRVNEQKIGELFQEPIEKADADFVREKTGFAIGGVPPVGHATKIEIFVDEDLLKYEEIWAAAGTPNAVFKLTPSDLMKITEGKVVSVK
ncbi:MAG TPA: YbaK/EbsC family protein [Blastocatellia bacterium]|nr:YbaK/EbsC family protein [Blastocatellia bacterium]